MPLRATRRMASYTALASLSLERRSGRRKHISARSRRAGAGLDLDRCAFPAHGRGRSRAPGDRPEPQDSSAPDSPAFRRTPRLRERVRAMTTASGLGGESRPAVPTLGRGVSGRGSRSSRTHRARLVPSVARSASADGRIERVTGQEKLLDIGKNAFFRGQDNDVAARRVLSSSGWRHEGLCLRKAGAIIRKKFSLEG